MYGDPDAVARPAGQARAIAIAFLQVQIEAGASAVQLFDSWAGALSPADYARYVLPHSHAELLGLASKACPGSTSASTPANCSASWPTRAPTWSASTGGWPSTRPRAGSVPANPLPPCPLRQQAKALQGNLDPAVLLAGWAAVAPRTREMLDRGRAIRGHIFNLGHGVLPETDPDVFARLVELVHETCTTTASGSIPGSVCS